MAMSEKEMRQNLATNIRTLREKCNLSLGEVAKLCHCPGWKTYPSSIERLEKKKQPPKIFHVYRLSLAFGVSISDLIETPTKSTLKAISKIAVDKNSKPAKLSRPADDDGI